MNRTDFEYTYIVLLTFGRNMQVRIAYSRTRVRKVNARLVELPRRDSKAQNETPQICRVFVENGVGVE